ncbi:hypothetical protein Q5P01_008269 [Channa striata]|uniref:Uncharacterized protein n=1 Tax=Channa striata TaxID=64152 RepID=A0AA88N884_CHASR|nr:hypothetical protein Q5P01_008269 [Channa striata]
MKVHHIFFYSFFLTKSATSQSSSSSSENITTSPTPEPELEFSPQLGVVVYACLILVVTSIALSVAAAKKLNVCPVETVDNNREVNSVYENTEDKPSDSHPGEVFSVYTCANHTKPNEVDSTEEYSLDAANCDQDQAAVMSV